MGDYRKMIMDGLREQYSEKEFDIQQVARNNGCSYEGVYEKSNDGKPCGPYVAIGPFEERLAKGTSDLQTVLKDIIAKLNERIHFEATDLRDFEKIKDKIFFRVINYDANRNLFANVPHREYLDLAVLYQVVVKISGDMQGNIVISNDMLKAWGITELELYELAYANSFLPEGLRIRTLENVVSDMCGGFTEGLDILAEPVNRTLMYVVDTGTQSFGSAAILEKESFKKLADKEGCDLFLIPSSTHEYIIVPKKGGVLAEKLKEMLWEVNYTVLDPEELLSNHIYQYLREKEEIVDLYEGENVDLEMHFSEKKFFLERV